MPDLSQNSRDRWFSEVRGPDVRGAYRPITRSGERVARASWLWIVACGIAFPVVATWRHQPLWFATMFLAVTPAMILLALTVRRRS